MAVPTLAEIDNYIAPAVVRDLSRRCKNVQRRARENVRGRGVSHPRRIDKLTLYGSIRVVGPYRRSLYHYLGRIGTPARHAPWVHNGTGIYGPHRTRIVPVRKKALHFRWAKVGRTVTFSSVAGMKPNPFLSEALSKARDA